MKVVQLVPSLSQTAAGVFVSVSHLVRYSIYTGSEVVVVAPKGRESETEIAAWQPAEIRRYSRLGPEKFGLAPQMVQGITAIDPDVVHAHGLWTFTPIAAYRWSRRTGKPYVLSVHGMLEPWSLRQSTVKKRIIRRLYQDQILNRAACLLATSTLEVESIRAAGLTCPIASVPMGVSLPPSLARRRVPRDRERTALFLSRIHPKKGLLNLVEAWRCLAPRHWQLRIVGPDDRGHRAQVERAVTTAGLSRSVFFEGPVWGEDRFRVYREADLFILPSFSENFAMVVAEALACELPVITTRGLPWKELEEQACGWWIELGVEPLVEALRAAISLTDEERQQMGSRGQRLVETRYSWGSAAFKMNSVYQWLIGRTGPPKTICFA